MEQLKLLPRVQPDKFYNPAQAGFFFALYHSILIRIFRLLHIEFIFMMDITSINSASLLQNLPSGKNEKSDLKSFADEANFSNTAKVFSKIDSFMNLSSDGRFNLDGMSKMNKAEQEEFLSMLSTLLQKGIVGYEELEVDGKKEKHYIINQIGNERLYGAKPWDDRRHSFSRYDER